MLYFQRHWMWIRYPTMINHIVTLRSGQNGRHFYRKHDKCIFLCANCCIFTPISLNSLWPSDAIWWQGSMSTLVQVMACCLTTLWSSDVHLRAISLEISHSHQLLNLAWNYFSNILLKSSRSQWFKLVSKVPNTHLSTLMQIMVWHWTGKEPLCEPMMTQITNTYVSWPQWVI